MGTVLRKYLDEHKNDLNDVMTAYVAHVGVLLCGRPMQSLVPEQRKTEEIAAEKDCDLLAEPKAE